MELLTQAYLPDLYKALGIYIPLIVVNCIILGRAEAFASRNKPLPSLFDGVGMGLGFTAALVVIGLVREFLGAGTAFGLQILSPEVFTPLGIFVRAPGAFLVLAIVVAVMNGANVMTRANEVVNGCDGCCASCAKSCKDKEERQ